MVRPLCTQHTQHIQLPTMLTLLRWVGLHSWPNPLGFAQWRSNFEPKIWTPARSHYEVIDPPKIREVIDPPKTEEWGQRPLTPGPPFGPLCTKLCNWQLGPPTRRGPLHRPNRLGQTPTYGTNFCVLCRPQLGRVQRIDPPFCSLP